MHFLTNICRRQNDINKSSRRNYSRADESEHAIEQLEEMLKTAGGESEHMAIKKAISILKNA